MCAPSGLGLKDIEKKKKREREREKKKAQNNLESFKNSPKKDTKNILNFSYVLL